MRGTTAGVTVRVVVFLCARIVDCLAVVGLSVCCLISLTTTMFAQEKPSDEQLAALVRQAVAGMHGTNDPIAMAGGLNRIGNPVVAELRTFKLVRWGEPRPDYLPVEVCARVEGHNLDQETLARAGMARLERKVFDVKLRMRIAKNDFGEWRAEMIRMEGNEAVQNALCSLGDATLSSFSAPSPAAPPSEPLPTKPDPAVDIDWASIEGQHPDAMTKARVKHNHSFKVGQSAAQDVWDYCEGMLFVYSNHIQFDARVATDDSRHSFDLQASALSEVKKNFFPIGVHSAFHIKAADGTNYNLITGPLEEVVKAIDQVRRAGSKR